MPPDKTLSLLKNMADLAGKQPCTPGVEVVEILVVRMQVADQALPVLAEGVIQRDQADVLRLASAQEQLAGETLQQVLFFDRHLQFADPL